MVEELCPLQYLVREHTSDPFSFSGGKGELTDLHASITALHEGFGCHPDVPSITSKRVSNRVLLIVDD